MKKFVKDNKGFSLVEILVAMAIFVLCAAPFLRSFVLAAQTNAKSRQILNATTIAENVMEDIKADGVDAYVTDVDGKKKLVPTGSNVFGDIYTTGYNNYIFDGKNYQVDITLEASDRAYEDKTGTEVSYNKVKLAELYKMNLASDAIYVQPEAELADVTESYVNDASKPEYMESPAQIIAHANTDYAFTITKTNTLYEVNQTITYKTQSGNEIAKKTATIYSSVQTGVELQKLYIFFVPSATNTISITNMSLDTDEQIEVYVVKQNTDSCEVNLAIMEDQIQSSANTHTRIRTNIEESGWNNIYYNTPGNNANLIDPWSMTKPYFGMDELAKTEDQGETRIYDATVVVKDSNGDEITTMTGTALR